MSITVNDALSVKSRAVELSCVIPQNMAMLPSNFETAVSRSEFLLPSEAATVRSMFRSNKISLDELTTPEERPSYIQNNGFEWAAPIIFIGYSLMSENQAVVSIALSVIANYVTDFLKGAPGSKTVKLDFVVEKSDGYSCKSIHYEGDIEGIRGLYDVIRKISNE